MRRSLLLKIIAVLFGVKIACDLALLVGTSFSWRSVIFFSTTALLAFLLYFALKGQNRKVP